MSFPAGSGPASVASRFLFLTFLLLGGFACTPERPAVEQLTFSTSDGVQLAGTVFHPERPKPPGIILVHREGGRQDHWQGFVQRAQAEGFRCMAFDLRGHGDSASPADKTWRAFSSEDWMACLQDIAAAKEVLLEQGTAPGNIFVMGEGLGANLALHYALGDLQVPGIVLVSPGWEYAGVSIREAGQRLEKLPMLLLVTEGDSYSAGTAAGLMQEARDFRELRTYPGAAHGADLFATSNQAVAQILHWLGIIVDEPAPEARQQENAHDPP